MSDTSTVEGRKRGLVRRDIRGCARQTWSGALKHVGTVFPTESSEAMPEVDSDFELHDNNGMKHDKPSSSKAWPNGQRQGSMHRFAGSCRVVYNIE